MSNDYDEEELRKALAASMVTGVEDSNDDELRAVLALSLATQEKEQNAREMKRAAENGDRNEINTVKVASLQSLTLLERMQIAAGPQQRAFRQFLEVPQNAGGIIVGAKYKHANEICSRAGGRCIIRFLPKQVEASNGDSKEGAETQSTTPAYLIIEADTKASVDMAAGELTARIADLFVERHHRAEPSKQQFQSAIDDPNNKVEAVPSVVLQPEQRRHIFVDNSNIFICAQSHNGHKNAATRIDALKLGKLLRKADNLDGTRVVAGSKPPASNAVWGYWESAGFRVKLAHREPDTNTETVIDDFLHAQIFNAVAKSHGDQPGVNTLVLCTGDGNSNDGYATFVGAARAAAVAHWRVEIWAWRNSCSKYFKQLVNDFPSGQVSIIYLDEYADKITFQSKVVTVNVKDQPAPNEKMSSQDVMKASVSEVDDVKLFTDEKDSSQEDDEAISCVVCMDSKRTHAIIPCGHYCLCENCINIVNTCPMCNGPKTSSIKVYPV
jgi:hypothetical protein